MNPTMGSDTPPSPAGNDGAPGLQIQLRPDELGLASRKAGTRLVQSLPPRRSPARVFGTCFAVGALAMLAYRTAGSDPEWWSYGLPILVFLGVCAAAFSSLLRRRQLMSRLGDSQEQHFSLALDDDGVVVRSGRGENRYHWMALEGIDADPGGVTLHFKGFQAVWIPARAFAAEAAQRRFIGRVEAATGLKASAPALPNTTLPPAGGHRKPSFWQDFAGNLRAGLLFLFFRPSGAARLRVSAGQFVGLAAASLAVSLAFDLIVVGSQGRINWLAIPGLLYGIPWLLATPWAASLGARTRSPLAGAVALAALWLPIHSLLDAWLLLTQLAPMPPWLDHQGIGYLGWLAVFVWGLLASMAALVRVLHLPVEERMAAILAVLCLLALPALVPQGETRLWVADHSGSPGESRADYERRLIPAREEALYSQPRLLDQALARIQPGRPGKPELFLLAVGGDGSQDVFRREVESVQQMFDKRFGTAGHSVVLLNNPETVLHQPVASVTALRHALHAMGKRMDRDEDVLLLFLTSHGSPDHRFDLSLWPYRFDELTPDRLRGLLDEAGIRYRVVVVSACYSGGFVPPLAGGDTLVISASRADRNSHGCSHEADWTFFGKAFFDEALRQTTSFESAFAAASHQVAAREKAEGLIPSEPQMAVGAGIRRALLQLEKGWPKTSP